MNIEKQSLSFYVVRHLDDERDLRHRFNSPILPVGPTEESIIESHANTINNLDAERPSVILLTSNKRRGIMSTEVLRNKLSVSAPETPIKMISD